MTKEKFRGSEYGNYYFYLVFISIFLLNLAFNQGTTSARDLRDIEQIDSSLIPRVARIFDFSELDSDGDGFIDVENGPQSGDIIFREDDGVTQVESGQYIIPNNIFYADHDGDDQLDMSPDFAKLVVVTRDNLTYLFEEGTNTLKAVFPNGTGRGGANTVASLRQVDAFLGSSWGEEMSDRLGFSTNVYGAITLGTSFFISDQTQISTAQEVHGTPDEWRFLLGTEVSGGCTRHSNQDIRRISQEMNLGDFVLTLDTPQDDQFDNIFNIYNLTRNAASLPPVEVTESLKESAAENLLSVPVNYDAMSSISVNEQSWQWRSFEQLPDNGKYINPIFHPFTRGEYDVIPCGSETIFLTALLNFHELLIPIKDGFIVNFSEVITLPDGSILNIDDFYTPEIIKPEDIEEELFLYSGGSNIQFFQRAVSHFAWQYGVYVSARDSNNWDLMKASEEEKGAAVNNLTNTQLREVQLVTGLIPGDYSWGQRRITGEPGDFLGALRNRTYMPGLMNIIYGYSGDTYELEFRDGMAYQVEDIQMNIPSPDHDFVRSSASHAESILDLLTEAVANKKSVVFRVTSYAALTRPIRYETGISNAHYFSLIPQYTDLKNGQVAIYDTMHPSEVLFVSLEDLDDIFSTMTISSIG